MTKKLIKLEVRSPYLNSVVVPAKFGTFTVSAAKLPAGRNRPMKGSIISLTNAFISAEAASECNSKSDDSKSLQKEEEFLSKSPLLFRACRHNAGTMTNLKEFA
jgi:hypothetical protein